MKYSAHVVEVFGPDSTRFLNGILSQDVANKESAGRALMLSPKGKLQCVLSFFRNDLDRYVLWTNLQNREALNTGIRKYLVADAVEIHEWGTREAWILPESTYSLQPITPRHPLGLEKIFRGIREEGALIAPLGILTSSHVDFLALNSGVENPASTSANEVADMHFKSGNPQWGLDLLTDDFVLEFPLSDAISFDKGCFVGQESVTRGTFRGKITRCYTRFESPEGLSPGALLSADGETRLGEIRYAQGPWATGLLKLDLPSPSKFQLEGRAVTLNFNYLVGPETYRKGR